MNKSLTENSNLQVKALLLRHYKVLSGDELSICDFEKVRALTPAFGIRKITVVDTIEPGSKKHSAL